MPHDRMEHPGVPGVVEIGSGFSIDSRPITREYMTAFGHYKLALDRLMEADRFAESCDAVDDRSDGASHNID